MNGVSVTVIGNVGNDPSLMTAKTGITWTQFRVASTRRWMDSEGKWVDGPTMWFTVKAWQDKAKNIAESLRKGVPVIVRGRLAEEPYIVTRATESGEPITELRNSLTIENAVVAIDLARGTARYTRAEREIDPPNGIPNWLTDKQNKTQKYSSISDGYAEEVLEEFEDEDELVPEPIYAMA